MNDDAKQVTSQERTSCRLFSLHATSLQVDKLMSQVEVFIRSRYKFYGLQVRVNLEIAIVHA